MWQHYLLGKQFVLMSDHIGLRYLFDQLNLNDRQARWLSTINEFDFEIRYIKGKENRVVDALSRWIEIHHLVAMSSYGTNLHDRILQAGQQDVRYMEIVHRLQQSTSTGTGDSIGTGTEDSIGTCDSIGIGTCTGAKDLDHCLTVDGLVRFRDRIYVLDNGELEKVILREFHVKPYSGHPGYPKTLTAVKIY